MNWDHVRDHARMAQHGSEMIDDSATKRLDLTIICAGCGHTARLSFIPPVGATLRCTACGFRAKWKPADVDKRNRDRNRKGEMEMTNKAAVARRRTGLFARGGPDRAVSRSSIRHHQQPPNHQPSEDTMTDNTKTREAHDAYVANRKRPVA
jgi:hypothetical protein